MSGAPWPWSRDISLVGNVDFDDLHADRYHFPVSRSYLSRSGCHGLRSPHPDPGSHHLQTPEGKVQATLVVAASPVVPWHDTCTTRVEQIQQSLVGQLSKLSTWASPRPHNPAVSEYTFTLVRQRRRQRRCFRIVCQRSDVAFLHLCFQRAASRGVFPSSQGRQVCHGTGFSCPYPIEGAGSAM